MRGGLRRDGLIAHSKERSAFLHRREKGGLRHQEGAHAHIRLDLSPVGNLSAEADIAFEAPEEPLWTACGLGWREQATLEVVNLKEEAMK